MYCKLPTNGKQLPAFPLKAVTGIEPLTSEVGGESVTTLPPWPPRSRFNDILQCCGLVQSVSGPTHLLGHTLDVLISPCDSDFVHNVSVGDFISDHAAIRCQLDFSHPSTSIDKWVSYRRYHRIDIDQFRNDLNNIP